VSVDWESFTDRTIEAAEVRLLGYADALSVFALQKLMMLEVRQQRQVSASVLICEHPPTLTAGRDASLLDLPTDRRELESQSLQLNKVARHGGTILHHPGQMAAYVVVSLDECGYGENEFCWRLQDATIQSCEESQVRVCRSEHNPNVLLGRHGLVAEVAVGVEDGVTCFGLFLNISCDLEQARQFGRGLRGQRISSLNAERVRPTIMPQIRTAMIRNLCEQIGYPEYHVHTGHPFMKRMAKVTGQVPNLPE
jgi:lipoate-protein ligase B